MNSYSLPILSRLPKKLVARFHSVSKLWPSILDRPYSTELFLSRSSAKPRLLFATVEGKDEWSFFSLPQRQNPYEKSSSSTLVVAAEFHAKLDMRVLHNSQRVYFSYGYASGLIYLYGATYNVQPLICNPITGEYATLSYLFRYRKSYSFFMFEPIDKQYKILFMVYPFCPDKHNKILTVGSGDLRWRTIKCSLRRHEVKSEGICINGVLYYLGDTSDCVKDAHEETPDYVIVCFDVRSEKFTFIDIDGLYGLVNYKGKLAVIYWKDNVNINWEEDDENSEDDVNVAASNDLCVWVLEDVEKQEWSKDTYTLSDDRFSRHDVYVAGVTVTGDIVFSTRKYTSRQPFYVFYFNPESNNLQCVEIQGFGEASKSVYTFVNHVQDLSVNHPKLLKSLHIPYIINHLRIKNEKGKRRNSE